MFSDIKPFSIYYKGEFYKISYDRTEVIDKTMQFFINVEHVLTGNVMNFKVKDYIGEDAYLKNELEGYACLKFSTTVIRNYFGSDWI